jgi:stage III sporulation protein AF
MAYAQCMEKLSEFSRDTQKIAYLNQDRYRTEYENVIAENIREKVDDMLQEYGLGTQSVTVELGEDHTMQEICIYITDENADEISVGRISVSDAAESGENQEVCGKVKEELAAYYGMEDSGIRVNYVGGT